MSTHRVAPAVVALLLGVTTPFAQPALHAQAAKMSGTQHPLIYVEITGPQGLFHGDGLTVHNAKASDISATTLGVEAESPHDARTGLASGKRQYKPVTFTHEVSPASIDLLNALARNEILKKVVISVYKTDANGMESKHYVVQLTNASVASVRQFTEDMRMLEEVTLMFDKIEVAFGNAQVAFADALK